MKKSQLSALPRYLTHQMLLRPDCLVSLKLPTYLTQQEANRLSAFMDALVLDPAEDDDNWPYETAADDFLEDLDTDDAMPEGEDGNGLSLNASGIEFAGDGSKNAVRSGTA